MPIPDQLKDYAARLGFPTSETMGAIFSILFADEAALALAAAMPGTAAELAQKTGIAQARVEAILTDLTHKGVVNHVIRKGSYRLFPAMIELRDATVTVNEHPRELIGLWETLVRKEMPALIGAFKDLKVPPMLRAVPIEETVQPRGAVMDVDSARRLFVEAALITAAPCPCRAQAKAVGRSPDCPAPESSVCMQTNGFAEAMIDRGIGERLTNAEALKRIGDAEDAGLVHLVRNNIKEDMFMCNCCSCCCTGLFMINELGYRDAYARSRFVVKYDEESCTGCGLCEDRCQLHAITMEERAVVDTDKCFGCGNCALVCPSGALSLVEARPVESIRRT
ncbi:MAG: 4Fe-4S binding protein [Deltaproteobacteria bacterium]|nr:4Fe-4S binding protein [Candidatus Zymogenaceae bacterium]